VTVMELKSGASQGMYGGEWPGLGLARGRRPLGGTACGRVCSTPCCRLLSAPARCAPARAGSRTTPPTAAAAYSTSV
jgi:hypothetical protein